MISRSKACMGNASVFTIFLSLVCIIVILLLFDLCCIYITREDVKAVSDSIALAAAQELVFLSRDTINTIARDLAAESGCRLTEIHAEYDEIHVTVEKDMDVTVLKMTGLQPLKTVRCSSRARVVYPWDRRWQNCRYYEFGYRPY